MPVVKYYEEQINCATAIKGPDYVRLYDENGACISAFDGVKDFSVFSIEDGVWYAPVSTDPPVTAVSSTKVGNDTISVTTATPWRAATGQELRFKSPCDSLGITTLRIDGVNYTLVDTLRNPLSTCQSAFSTNSFVDVLLNVQDKTAYAINPANNTYIDGQLKAAAKVVVSMNEPSASDNIAAGYSIGAMWLRPCYTLTNMVYALEATSITHSACTVNKSKQTFTVAGNGDDKVISVSYTMPTNNGWLYAVVTPDSTASSATIVVGDKTVELTPGNAYTVCVPFTGTALQVSATYNTANTASSGVILISNLTVIDKTATLQYGVDAGKDLDITNILSNCSSCAPFDVIVIPTKLWQHDHDSHWEVIYGVSNDIRDRCKFNSAATNDSATHLLLDSRAIPLYLTFCGNVNADMRDAAFGKNNEEFIANIGRAMAMYCWYKGDSKETFPYTAIRLLDTLADIANSSSAWLEIANSQTMQTFINASDYAKSYFTSFDNEEVINTAISLELGIGTPDTLLDLLCGHFSEVIASNMYSCLSTFSNSTLGKALNNYDGIAYLFTNISNNDIFSVLNSSNIITGVIYSNSNVSTIKDVLMSDAIPDDTIALINSSGIVNRLPGASLLCNIAGKTGSAINGTQIVGAGSWFIQRMDSSHNFNTGTIKDSVSGVSLGTVTATRQLIRCKNTGGIKIYDGSGGSSSGSRAYTNVYGW